MDGQRKVQDAALRLPAEERARLAGRLIESLDETSNECDPAAWAAEVRRRVNELEEGTATPVAWERVRTEG